MGYSSAQIYFDVPERSGGNSSWSLFRLARYAVSAIVSFTSFPLHIISGCGLLTFLLSMVFGGKALFDKLSGNAVDGFATVILLILFIGSALMFSIGLIGIYIAQIYDEVKSRPSYIVSRKGTSADTVSHENACTERKEDKMP
jgi:dolichol-phosphate mannosyltransferase